MPSSLIIILHNAVPPEAPPDESDVLVQVQAVEEALISLGYATERLALDLAGLGPAVDTVVKARPCCVFNLVEAIDGRESLQSIIPQVLEAHGIPFTGVGAQAMLATGSKTYAKHLMGLAGLPTPAWQTVEEIVKAKRPAFDAPYIVKSGLDHGSLALEETSVFSTSADLMSHLAGLPASRMMALMAEQYVEGREFNISLMGARNQPRILPLAEIRFDGWQPGRPRVVGYRAKWDAASWEYHHTPRQFDFPPEDAGLLQQLRELSHRCWDLFGLQGYARVDFRVDSAGAPWILEVNANPCIAPDAGFAAAAQRDGMSFRDLVLAILRSAGSGAE